MERIHMNIYTEIIYRLREKESERSISRDLGISRPTVHKYKLKALLEGYLDSQKELPEREELAKSLGPDPQPPKTPSTVEGYQEAVQKYLKQGLEMTAIFQRLRDDYGYQGSYSSVRRFVHHVRPEEKEAYVRVHSEPGEELQVDFGSIGLIYDPKAGKMRKGHALWPPWDTADTSTPRSSVTRRPAPGWACTSAPWPFSEACRGGWYWII